MKQTITWFDELKELQEFLIICKIYRFGLKTAILIEKNWWDDIARILNDIFFDFSPY